MPDITQCLGTGCPLKNTCYRFTAKPDSYQTYFDEVPYDNGCTYYDIDTSCDAKFLTLEVAKKFPWGTYGKSGKGPLRYISLGAAKTDHLEAIAKQPKISKNYCKAIKLILKERQKPVKKIRAKTTTK